MSGKLTPMMRQYQTIRRGLPDNTLLLFRLGDFYEMFFEDAREAAGILNVALTKRNGIPMCGVPHHAAEGYIAKLVKAGKRAAICEQVGEPRAGRIVEREIREIISPGTVSDINLLDARRNNYLASVMRDGRTWGMAAVDLSTGEFIVSESPERGAIEDELARLAPSETLRPDNALELEFPDAAPYDAYAFLRDHAFYLLCDHFGVHSLDGFGCRDLGAAIGCAGALLHYLTQQLRRDAGHLRGLRVVRANACVELGRATQEHLELVDGRGARDTTLLGALDRTATPMGARRLRDWILHPLREVAPIRHRQQAVADLADSPVLLADIREKLGEIRDIERTVGRLSQGSGTPRDIVALRASLAMLPALRALLAEVGGMPGEGLGTVARETADPKSMAIALLERIREFPDLVDLLERAIVDDPPATLKDGGVFRQGYHKELDETRRWSTEGKEWLARLQQREVERTGVKSLKIKYNAVFGYFIEITKSNLGNVPEDYMRKQTMANAERFITPELKEMEGKILRADESARALEASLFSDLRKRILDDLDPLQRTAAGIAELDVLGGFAETARQFGYCRPVVDDSLDLRIVDGRHPVLDQNVGGEKFVPNDAVLDGSGQRLLLITGPNMAGKSTYIRQVALIVLMAQTGSFVPATEAHIGVVDKIFTRVGASDDLSRGQSTFMVEMNETASIVHNATGRSLVILDEIGRGTSTFDGLSIAWSVAEHLHDTLRARTLFATHYHELTDLARTRDGVRNYNVSVREWNDRIVFLHKIVPGTADKSYGIQVAKLAGLPDSVIRRAKDILANLEEAELNADGSTRPGGKTPGTRKPAKAKPIPTDDKPQMSLF